MCVPNLKSTPKSSQSLHLETLMIISLWLSRCLPNPSSPPFSLSLSPSWFSLFDSQGVSRHTQQRLCRLHQNRLKTLMKKSTEFISCLKRRTLLINLWVHSYIIFYINMWGDKFYLRIQLRSITLGVFFIVLKVDRLRIRIEVFTTNKKSHSQQPKTMLTTIKTISITGINLCQKICKTHKIYSSILTKFSSYTKI
jgi:hypothetical protein